MCSATQFGLRVWRLNEEVVLRVAFRSLMGPGKPYWKRPLGLTGGIISLSAKGRDPAAGAGGPVEVGVEEAGEMAGCRSFEEA